MLMFHSPTSDQDSQRGPGVVKALAHRLMGRVVRPFIAPLVERLEKIEGRLVATEAQMAEVVRRLDIGRDRNELAFDKIRHCEGRQDDAESRLDQANRSFDEVNRGFDDCRRQIEGTSKHLESLTGEHHELDARFEKRVIQLLSIARSVEGLDRDQRELEEKLEAVRALHWDHIALTRRLSAIEGLLAASPPTVESELPLPFPGFEDASRSRAG